MKKTKTHLILLTVLIFVSVALIYSQNTANLSTVSGRSQAMWVFAGGENPNPITNAAARNRLIVESRSSGVDKLYLSVYQPTLNSNGRRMYEDSTMAEFMNRAHSKRRQEVWAAYGAPDWAEIGCSPTAFPLQRMAEVAAYNNSRKPSDRFDGVILDVEPNEPQSETDFRALLNLYQCVRQNLPSNIKLAVAIRFFWDLPIAYPIGGTVKPVHQHIIDMNLDNVVVMGYRDFAGTSDCAQGDGMICLDKDEIAYASSLNKPKLILIGIETRNPFPDLLDKETFYEEGHAAILSETQIVTNFFSSSISFGGYAIHNYNSAYLSGTNGWESPNLPLP
ncbi:MAG TPA: hypothetical protein PKE69_03925 [Pyrinomonadaceae bacterium]|nr:hypothetical protein [Pyrinomonadaceae bacterium]